MVHWLEEQSDVSNGAPEIVAVAAGSTSDGQVLCSVDDVVARLGGPQGFQVVTGIAA